MAGTGLAWRLSHYLRAHLSAVSQHSNQTNKQRKKIVMKLKKILQVCGVVVALGLAAVSLQAQDNGGAPGGDQGGGGRRRGGNGGPGGGNFDPAAMQQRMMDRVREELNFTNDTDWSAVEPLIQKVSDARREVGGGGMGRMFGRNRGGNNGGGNGGNGGGRGGMFGTPSPEEEVLQKAIDDNVPAGQIKDALAKYRASHKEKQAKLEAAQAELKKVLSTKQEAQAALLGLVQ